MPMKKNECIFTTPHGQFAIDIVADAKMASIFQRGEYHQNDTIELLSKFITPDSVFVDAGAHVGTITVPMARKTPLTIAYEADAQTCDILKRNIELNGVHADVRSRGLGARAGFGSIMSADNGNAGAHALTPGHGEVSIVALDDELQHIDVMKLDVEGMEFAVLQGASRIMKESRPVVLFEVNISQLRAHGASLSEMEMFLKALGYRLYLPFRYNQQLVLGAIPRLPLIALLYYPGAYILRRVSSVFDIVALHHKLEVPLPTVSVFRTASYVITENVRNKIHRMRHLFN